MLAVRMSQNMGNVKKKDSGGCLLPRPSAERGQSSASAAGPQRAADHRMTAGDGMNCGAMTSGKEASGR